MWIWDKPEALPHGDLEPAIQLPPMACAFRGIVLYLGAKAEETLWNFKGTIPALKALLGTVDLKGQPSSMTENSLPASPLWELRIRHARGRDMPALVSLFRSHLEYHASLDPRYAPGSDAHLTQFFNERLRDPETLILLAETPQGAQGYILAQMRGPYRPMPWWERLWWRVHPSPSPGPAPKVAYIADCFVVPEARRQRIGRRLVEQALEWCQKRGAQEVELGVLPDNPLGRAFWEALGFKPCRIEMRRQL